MSKKLLTELKDVASFKRGWKSYAFYAGLGLGALSIGKKIYKRMNRKSFNNQIAVVTGGAQGLGKKVAKRLLDDGCIVVVWDINVKRGEATVEEFNDDYGEGMAHFYKVNVANYETVKEAAEAVQKDIGPVQILVNNAGIVAKEFVYEQSIESMKRVMDVNIMAHFWTVKCFLPDLIKYGGSIVNIASVAAMGGTAGMAVYCASKCAVFGFTESLRIQFQKDGHDIDVLTVMPYYMKGEMFDGVNSIIPLLDMDCVADQVIVSMKEGDAELIMPFYFRYFNHVTRAVYPPAMTFVQKHLGLLDSMDTLIEKAKKERGKKEE